MLKLLRMLLCVALLLVMTASGASAATFAPDHAEDALHTALDLVGVCAFGAEYGDEHNLARWEQPLRVYVSGSPTNADNRTLNEFFIDLAVHVPGMPNVTRVDSADEANVFIYFVPLNQMGDYLPNYVEGNWGYVTYWYNSRCEITRMKIAIATDVTNQKSRNHLIKEEFVGGLGLASDHDEYSDSILYQPWTTTQELSDLDWLMLNMVYHPDVTPGMTWSQFYQTTYQRISDR